VLVLSVQNFSHLLQGKHFQIVTGVEKMCVFELKTGHIWETVRDRA